MRSGTPLFYLAMQNPSLEAVFQIVELLGKLPPLWKVVQLNKDGYLERYGCENPAHLPCQVEEFPLDAKVKDIETERIILPTVTTELRRGKPSSKAWKRKPASSEIRAHIKNNPDIFWKHIGQAHIVRNRYYQLKVGHGAVGTFLAKIGVIETPQCWWCKEPVQSVEHLYAKCRRWRKERRKLVRELEKEGVRWQPQVERRWLAGLLANEKAVAPLLSFSKTTEPGGREGAREREAEWERRNDRAGEDLLE